MKMTPVTSTLLKSYAYSEDKNSFIVQFADNLSFYAYLNVDPLVFDAFLEAPSQGSYFVTNICGKKGQPPIHEYRKLGGADIMDADGNISDDLLNFNEPKVAEPTPAPRQGKPLPPAPDIHRPAPKAIVGEVMQANGYIPELPAKDEELKVRALSVMDEARTVVINSGIEFSAVSAKILTIKAERKMVFDRLQRVYTPAYNAYIEARTLRDESVAPYDEAEKLLKQAQIVWDRREKAERARQEQERNRLAQEQAKLDAEELSRQIADQEAAVLEQQGELALAESVRANPLPIAPAPVAPVVLERDVPKGPSSIKEKWEWKDLHEVNLLLDIFPGITQAQVTRMMQFFSADKVKINAYAKATKLAGTIPGAITIYDAGSVSTRSK